MEKKSRFKEALSEQYNVLSLAGAAALSLALMNPLPLIVAGVAEAAYLLFVPDSKWYEKRLSHRFDAEIRERREKLRAQVFPQIPAEMQERFNRLAAMRNQIEEQNPTDERWFREVVRKLDYLLEQFLHFALKDAELRNHLRSVRNEVLGIDARPNKPPRQQNNTRNSRRPEFDLEDVPPPIHGTGWVARTVQDIVESYERQIATVQKEQEVEDDHNTQALLSERADVLAKRRDQIIRLGKILTNLGHQLDLLGDSFGLINDQLRARTPEQVLADIEGVVSQTEDMTRLLDELAPYERLSARLDS